MRWPYFLFFGIFIFCLTGCVESNQFEILETRVAAIEMDNNRQLRQKEISKHLQTKLEQDIAGLKNRLDENPGITQETYAEMKYDIQTIRVDFQRLEGLIGEVKHEFSRFTQNDQDTIENQIGRLDLAISKNYEKLLKLEKYMGFEPSVAGEKSDPDPLVNLEPGKQDPGKQDPGETDEQELYNLAKKMFDDGDKENARIQFENFINKYPESANADNARYWIADSFYVEKWYEKAILEYQEVLDNYPNSNKLAAARLKQGYAFAELGEIANARLILRELVKKHPDSNEAKYAKKKLKHLK
ncbi:MAG: tol-pal system protein YbgF [Desulfobacula sp.]|nr:tol-pal system protein YbgF [Desulfobacula sp.]